MKNILTKNLIIALIIIGASIAGIIFSVNIINFDSSIEAMLPQDKNLKFSLKLNDYSSIKNKVILFIESENEEKLKQDISLIEEEISKSSIDLEQVLPTDSEFNQIRSYLEYNSLLLYPYEKSENPFTEKMLEKGLNNKLETILSNPFFVPTESFFFDPLNFTSTILKEIFGEEKRNFNYYKQGIIANNNKVYIKIFNFNALMEEYDKIKLLKKLDKVINKTSKENNFEAFLYSAHLYFLESQKSATTQSSIIFIFSIIATLAIFYYFFKSFKMLVFSMIPVIGGISLTFLFIAIFKKNFGVIPFAFGATTAGIAIDYSIHYITKLRLYHSLSLLRKKIGSSLFLGFITTFLSFIMLPFSKVNALTEIALFGMLVITFAFLISWFVLQKLLPPGQEYIIKEVNLPKVNKTFTVIYIIIIGIFVVLSIFSRLEDSFMALDMKHKELDKRAEKVKAHFNESTDSVFLVFSGSTESEVVENTLKGYNIIKNNITFFSSFNFMPSSETIQSRKNYIKSNLDLNLFKSITSKSDFDKDTFTLWSERIKNIDQLQLSNIPKYIKSEYDKSIINIDNTFYTMTHIHDRELVKEISNNLKQNNIEHFVVDVLESSKSGLLLFEKKALVFLFLSIILIFLILSLSYKSMKFAFIALLPAFTGLAGAVGLVSLLGVGINIMHITAYIMILGIGVDYGIFIAGSIRKAYSRHETHLTLQAILTSALTTLAGFGILAFASNGALFSLGSSMFIGIVFSFITSYIILSFMVRKDDETV